MNRYEYTSGYYEKLPWYLLYDAKSDTRSDTEVIKTQYEVIISLLEEKTIGDVIL